MASPQPGSAPPSSPPTLNVSPTISKHASSYPSSLLISHLLAAAINHLLFARGQIAFPVSTLQKRAPPPGARRDRKRDATLQALEQVGRHVGAALSAGGGKGDGDGTLPLLVLFGPSALSPLEAFAISIRHPPLPPPSSSSPASNGEPFSAPPPPTLKKLLSTLEQRLVRFLIATEELQDALANTLRPTKMHLFVLRPEGWRAEGWKPRRGFRAQLGRVWGEPKMAEEGVENGEDEGVVESGAAQGGAERQPPQRGEERSSSSTRIGKGLPSQPANLAAADPPPALASASTAEEDVGILSEALSPLKKRRRPPLVARTSSSYSSTASGVNGFQSPRASSAMLLKTPSSSKVVKTTAMRHLSGAESVLWSPQPAAAMRRMDFSAALGARTSFEPVRSGLTLESSSSDEERPSGLAVEPPPPDPSSSSAGKALNGSASSRCPTGVIDDRPPGSRLFPASSSRSASSSLLARSRIGSREKSSPAGIGVNGGASAPTRSRPRTKLKGPKGAAFVIDCGGGDKEGGSREDDATPRRLGFEPLDEKGCALPGWQWFQCDVSVPAYLGS